MWLLNFVIITWTFRLTLASEQKYLFVSFCGGMQRLIWFLVTVRSGLFVAMSCMKHRGWARLCCQYHADENHHGKFLVLWLLCCSSERESCGEVKTAATAASVPVSIWETISCISSLSPSVVNSTPPSFLSWKESDTPSKYKRWGLKSQQSGFHAKFPGVTAAQSILKCNFTQINWVHCQC